MSILYHAINIGVRMNQEKDMKEWKLAQLFRLQAELAVFGCKCVPVWDHELTSDKVKFAADDNQEASKASLSGTYAQMWDDARSGSLNIIEHANESNREECSWLLDKRLNLRRELEEYGAKVLPELAAALGENHAILQAIDERWCQTWKMALDLVTKK